MYHYRKTHKVYKSFPKPAGCSFCDDDLASRALKNTAHALVIPNRVSYDLWELREVTEHLMVIPKQHVHSLAELEDAALLDIMKIIAEYEAKGYNIYARAVGSTTRSVPHQHTHLIKTQPKSARGGFVLRRPHVVVRF